MPTELRPLTGVVTPKEPADRGLIDIKVGVFACHVAEWNVPSVSINASSLVLER